MQISNNQYRIALDEANGALTSFSNGQKEYIYYGTTRPLFTIRFRNEEGTPLVVSALDASAISVTRQDRAGEESVQIDYSHFGAYSLSVRVSIRCPHDNSLTYWRIAVDNQTGWPIEWIDFPDVVVPNDLTATGGTGKIVWPFNEGALVEDTSIRESSWFPYIEPEYPSRATAGIYPAIVSTQFMAYYGDQGGLYIGAHDAQGHTKCIEYYAYEEGIRLQFRLYPGGGQYDMDYDMVLGVFRGDWHDAADIYHTWYETTITHRGAPLVQNDNLPDWYAESPVVVTYPVRGKTDADQMDPNPQWFPYVNGLPCLDKLANALDSKIMALLMHWEGTAPWAPPYVWPPYGGEQVLRDFSDGLHESGHLLGLYCSGLGWTEQSNLIPDYNRKAQFDREHLVDIMLAPPAGEMPYSTVCTTQRRGYDMCPTQAFTVDTITQEVRQMIAGGCDYIQVLDQNHGGNCYFCFSPSHGHPPGPGKWQTDSMTQLLDKLQEVTKQVGKQVLFGCESAAAEPFIPGLLFSDLRYNLNFMIGTPIPLYAYLYHEYVNNFMGNQVCTNGAFDYAKSPDNFVFRLAYSFHAGDMATLVLTYQGEIAWSWGAPNNDLPNQEDVLTFIRRTNAWRRGAGKPYLHYGRMVKPFPLQDVPNHLFHMVGGREWAAPAVLSSCWQALDDSLGQVLVNYTQAAIECAVLVGEATNRTITRLEEADGSRREELSVDRNGLVHCTVQPLSALLLTVDKG